MNKTVKVVIAVVVLAVIGVTAGLSWKKQQNKPVEVRIESVEERDLVASVTASGQVEPQTKVDVASDITGKIVTLAVREGQSVTKGQFLLEIDAQQAEAALQRADASLSTAKAQEAQARASLLQAQRSYDRDIAIKKLNATSVSDEELEQLKSAVEVAQAVHEASQHGVEEADAGISDAKSALEKTKLFAPMAGRVTRLNVEQGETAIMGTLNKDAATLLTISDMSVLETRVHVDETDVARIKIGESAIVQMDAFPDTTFVGKVTKISNSSVRGAAGATTTDQAVDYEVTVQLLNQPPETRPDFSTTAKIVTDQRKHVLSVPIIAVTLRENTPVGGGDTAQGLGRAKPSKDVGKKDIEGVFVLDSANKVTFRPVKVGIAGEKDFEILSGLKGGERIVAGTYQAIRDLKDGTTVHETKPDSTKTDIKKPPQGSKP